MKRWIALTLLIASASPAEPVAVVRATVHPIVSEAIENGVVVFDGGRITAVGRAGDVVLPSDAAIIEAPGRHIWPGLIDALTYLGLTEIGSIRGTADFRESGELNPNARAEVSINASSSHIPVTRANGTLLAAVLPRDSMVPGLAAAIALDGWTWEEMVRQAPIGLVIHWPGMREPFGEKKDERPTWEERVARLDEMIAEARAYDTAMRGQTDRDPDVRWESLRSVINGETPVWIHATTLIQVRAALDWTERQGLEMVLVDGGGRGGDAWRCAEVLRERDIAVVTRTNRRPQRMYEPYDTPYAAAGKLHAAGVRVAFGSWNSAHARNLPHEAARAVSYGMPRAAAERSLTLGAAELLGIHEDYGSLEVGKSATLLIVDGDLLDTRMHVTRAWLDGDEVDLESRHTQLWKKWSGRPLPTDAGVLR